MAQLLLITWWGNTIFPISFVEDHCSAVAEAVGMNDVTSVAEADAEDLQEKELYTFLNSAGASGGAQDALVVAVAAE